MTVSGRTGRHSSSELTILYQERSYLGRIGFSKVDVSDGAHMDLRLYHTTLSWEKGNMEMF